MKTASFPRTRVLVCATALLTAPVLVAEEAAGLLAVDLRVTSPAGTEVPIRTVTNSPVAIADGERCCRGRPASSIMIYQDSS